MQSEVEKIFLESSIRLFRHYKSMGEKAFGQLTDEQILVKPNGASNSIALIVHHLSGNMLSRFTDFLTTDGEKPWRNREAEFEIAYSDKESMIESWNKGWSCLFETLSKLTEEDLLKIIFIRNEGHTVLEAIQRQLAHYSSHVGQIVFQAKALKGNEFTSLTIPKGGTEDFNKKKFEQEKTIRHFTDGV